MMPDGVWAVLRVLAHPARPALSYDEIASDLEVTKGTVSRHVQAIVDHGWATIDRHGRQYRVTVTDDGVAAAVERQSRPTVAAVLAEARRIVRDARARMEVDPYARPYIPSDDAARKLSQIYGPEVAIAVLREREADRRGRQVEEDERSERAERDRAVQARAARREVEARRDDLTFGQRIDRALTRLRLVQVTPAVRLDADPVSTGGGGGNAVPKLHGDTAGWAERRVDQLLRSLEDAADDGVRRRFEFERHLPRPTPVAPVDLGEREEDLDRALLRHRGRSPEQVSEAEPDLGTPGDVRRRRAGLDLREVDGEEPLDESETERLKAFMLAEGCSPAELARALDWSLGRAYEVVAAQRPCAPVYGQRSEEAMAS